MRIHQNSGPLRSLKELRETDLSRSSSTGPRGLHNKPPTVARLKKTMLTPHAGGLVSRRIRRGLVSVCWIVFYRRSREKHRNEDRSGHRRSSHEVAADSDDTAWPDHPNGATEPDSQSPVLTESGSVGGARRPQPKFLPVWEQKFAQGAQIPIVRRTVARGCLIHVEIETQMQAGNRPQRDSSAISAVP